MIKLFEEFGKHPIDDIMKVLKSHKKELDINNIQRSSNEVSFKFKESEFFFYGWEDGEIDFFGPKEYHLGKIDRENINELDYIFNFTNSKISMWINENSSKNFEEFKDDFMKTFSKEFIDEVLVDLYDENLIINRTFSQHYVKNGDSYCGWIITVKCASTHNLVFDGPSLEEQISIMSKVKEASQRLESEDFSCITRIDTNNRMTIVANRKFSR